MALSAVGASACNEFTGAREQRVFVEWDGKSLFDWAVVPGEIQKVDLPNSFPLGVSIEPATPQKYEEARSGFPYVPELVKITLFDMGTEPPSRLTTTWGGANSIQGFGASGGADRVEQLGDPGITLILLNPVCAADDQIDAGASAAAGS